MVKNGFCGVLWSIKICNEHFVIKGVCSVHVLFQSTVVVWGIVKYVVISFLIKGGIQIMLHFYAQWLKTSSLGYCKIHIPKFNYILVENVFCGVLWSIRICKKHFVIQGGVSFLKHSAWKCVFWGFKLKGMFNSSCISKYSGWKHVVWSIAKY